MKTYTTSLINWFDKRYNIKEIIGFITEKKVPIYKHTIWYYMGGITLLFFIIQVFTGILLLLYYRPTPEEAFESVQFIMTQVHYGWLIRSIHSWSANLMILFAFIHMFSVLLLKSYRPPRELTWVTGVLLMYISLAFGFTGYLLPWNELSFFATKVGTDIAGVIPFIGKFIIRFLRGGEDVTGATLTRLFGFHVAVLPGVIIVILVIHLLMVQRQGMSKPIGLKEVKKGMLFFPDFFLRDLLGWLFAVGILAALAAIFPWELGQKADPFSPAPEGIKPEWYFLFMFQTLKFFPARILILDGEVIATFIFAALGIFWILVPFLDSKARREQKSPIFTIIGIFAILYVGIITILSYFVFK